MGFITAVKTAFAKYAVFHGRATRAEYWHFTLFLVVLAGIAYLVDIYLLTIPAEDFGPASLISTVATLVPCASISARRLHDTDRSGWWQLLWLLPVVGWILIIVWSCLRGTAGDNRFGPPSADRTANLSTTAT